MLVSYKHPSPLSVPVDEKPPVVQAPPANYDSDYMDGTCEAYQGANPGRDQDRSRVDECSPASYSYAAGPVGTEQENETGTMEGY